MVNLIPRQRTAPVSQRLICGEDDVGIEQAEPVDTALPALDGVLDPPAQHLETSADSQHHPP